MFTSSIYSFCVTLPSDNGFSPTSKNTANFVLANSLGEGFLITPIGYSMSYFGFKSLIMLSFILIAIANWSFYEALSCMEKDKALVNQQTNK